MISTKLEYKICMIYSIIVNTIIPLYLHLQKIVIFWTKLNIFVLSVLVGTYKVETHAWPCGCLPVPV